MPSQQHASETAAEAAIVDFQQPTLSASDEWLSSYADDVIAVGAFCQEHDILSAAKAAIDLVNKHFPLVQDLKLVLSGDAESDAEWLVIEFDAAGGVEAVLDAYAKLKREWVSTIQGRGMARVRFLYNIR
jgi:hypothetical protein